jgi:hypothetical protein
MTAVRGGTTLIERRYRKLIDYPPNACVNSRPEERKAAAAVTTAGA